MEQISKDEKQGWYLGVSNIDGVLLDISGVLYNSGEGGGRAIEGSVEAVRRLQASDLPVRFCTNETQCTRNQLVAKLQRLGFSLEVSQVFPPAPAACHVMRERNLRPHLLVHPDCLPEFSSMDQASPNCVVLGDAAEYFTYQAVNQAFRVLMELENPVLISMGQGKYYKETSGMMIDVGAYMKALEYACDVKAEVIGKPSPVFFKAVLDDMAVKPENAVMIGDDIVNDIGGAQACGMTGVQVRTGKFRPSDENHPTVKPDGYVDNLLQAVNLILEHR